MVRHILIEINDDFSDNVYNRDSDIMRALNVKAMI